MVIIQMKSMLLMSSLTTDNDENIELIFRL